MHMIVLAIFEGNDTQDLYSRIFIKNPSRIILKGISKYYFENVTSNSYSNYHHIPRRTRGRRHQVDEARLTPQN